MNRHIRSIFQVFSTRFTHAALAAIALTSCAQDVDDAPLDDNNDNGGTMADSIATTANTGGCTNYSAHGYNVGVCISNMNGTVLPDLYVNRSVGTTGCRIDIETWDDHKRKYGSTSVDCLPGHKI